jgi:hypothetical protein
MVCRQYVAPELQNHSTNGKRTRFRKNIVLLEVGSNSRRAFRHKGKLRESTPKQEPNLSNPRKRKCSFSTSSPVLARNMQSLSTDSTQDMATNICFTLHGWAGVF